MTTPKSPIDAAAARRWAAEHDLEFPNLTADDEPEWIWHEGCHGEYTGYLPADWDEGEACAYYDGEDQEDMWGVYVRVVDLGVCTVVTRGELDGWEDDPVPIPRLVGHLASWDWFVDDELLADRIKEISDWAEPAFSGFDEVSSDAGDDPEGSGVASINGWYRHGPYSEWYVELIALDDGRFTMRAGPPLDRIELTKTFDDLGEAARQMATAAEILGSTVDVAQVWADRNPTVA